MKNFTKLLYVFTTLSLIISCSIRAQEKMLKSGNLTVGEITYLVRNPQNKSLILVTKENLLDLTWDIAKNSSKRDVIPRTELKLNVSELKELKNKILGDHTSIIVRFYYGTDEKLIGLEYEINKNDNLTVDQFKKFDKAVRKNFKASFVKSFDYSNYLPYVVRSVILR